MFTNIHGLPTVAKDNVKYGKAGGERNTNVVSDKV